MIKYMFSLAIIFQVPSALHRFRETLSAFLMVIHWKYYRIKNCQGPPGKY